MGEVDADLRPVELDEVSPPAGVRGSTRGGEADRGVAVRRPAPYRGAVHRPVLTTGLRAPPTLPHGWVLFTLGRPRVATTGSHGAARAPPTAHRELIALQGQIVKGKVVRLEEYGAFVEVTTEDGGAVTGLVHVSEVSTEFIENIYAELAEGDEVEVKVLDIKEDGKVDLSIKRADPDWQDEESVNLRSKLDKDFNKRLRRFMHKSQMIQGEARRQKRGRIE
jgi:predicted RNA-binding protein with RPS1 domain